MAHLKRQEVPTSWPIPRKGTKYVVRPNLNLEAGIPLLIALRNMLKVCENRDEVKKAITAKNILRNSRPAKDERNPLFLFDTLSLVPTKKSYRLELTDNGKFKLTEIKDSEAIKKIAKVDNKRTIKGKKTQINLGDGTNYISDMKCDTNDSVIVNLKDKKIEKCLQLKEGSKIVVFGGKHSGKKGEIRKLKLERKMASVKVKDQNLNVLIKQIIVVE